MLDVVAGLPREWDVIEACAAAVREPVHHGRATGEALAARARFPRRAWLAQVLADVAAGTASVLEHGYLAPGRSVRTASRPPIASARTGSREARIYRDAPYPAYDLDVELDGRLDHSALAGPRTATSTGTSTRPPTGARSVRLGWGQVYDRPCRTAAQVARLLHARRLGGHADTVLAHLPGRETADSKLCSWMPRADVRANPSRP